MKTFQQLYPKAVTIHGDFNGTLNVGSEPVQQEVEEQESVPRFDVVLDGKYRG